MKAFKLTQIILMIISSFNLSVFAQTEQNEVKEKIKLQILTKTDTIALKNLNILFKNDYNARKYEKIDIFLGKGYPIKGSGFEFEGFLDNKPVYYQLHNRIAAQTTSTDDVWSIYNLDGSSIEIGLWDGGAVDEFHNSFREGSYGPRHVFFIDSTGSSINSHATHVAGTIVADNDNYNSKGMADKSVLYSWDWSSDVLEMTNAAAGFNQNLTVPLLLSNHSYGKLTGWAWADLRGAGTNEWYWMAEDRQLEDLNFGNYNYFSYNNDLIAYNAPYYTIVRSAGNDRGEGPEPYSLHWVWDPITERFISSTSFHPKDGWVDGFNCLPPDGVAKNIITVGAIDDIPNGWSSTTDVKQINTSFSSWGPTRDGRIKPDIVANGDQLYSTLPNNSFGYKSGTSMAAPNVTGSLALLLQHYKNTHSNNIPLSSTLKAIVIHTADEAGEHLGPDYKFGWGLLNTYKAVQLISQDQISSNTIQELLLQNGQSYTLNDLYSDGTQPIKITLVWNDIPPSNYQTGPILVNDLDIRLYKDGTPFYPWILNPGNPGAAASTGDNTKDNVEQIFLQSPGVGFYSVVVTHKSSLMNSGQMFSLIVTGFTSPFVSFHLKQIGNDGQAFGNASYWDNSIWNPVSPTQPVTLPVGNNHFLSIQDFRPATYEKFNRWMDNLENTNDWFRNWEEISLSTATNLIASYFIPKHQGLTIKNSLEETSVTAGALFFADPWLTDINEPPYGLRNQGVSAPFKQRTSPFYPDYTTSYNGDVYKGVFLNQGINELGQWQPPYYSVKTDYEQNIFLNQTGRTHKFYFQGWSASPEGSAGFQNANANQTPVVFKQANATVQANLKGTQLSNNSLAYSKGSQRKFVRLTNGHLVSVYESMGNIYLERSTDNGASWHIFNQTVGEKLNSLSAHSPSMDFYNVSSSSGDVILITFVEEMDAELARIVVVGLADKLPSPLLFSKEVSLVDKTVYGYGNPVIACSGNGKFLIAFKGWDTSDDGIYYRRGSISNWQLNWVEQNPFELPKVPNTNNFSINPTIAEDRSTSGISYQLAWEQSGQIMYCKLNEDANGVITQTNYSVVSSGSSFMLHSSPSIIAIGSGARICWLGYDDAVPSTTSVVFKDPAYSRFWSFGGNVSRPNINKSNDNTYYALAWSQNNSTVKFADNNLRNIYEIINIPGCDVQISNGNGKTNMFANIFKATTQPYFFTMSNNLNYYYSIQKSNGILVSNGRSGVLRKNNSEIYFALGDYKSK